MMDRVCFVAMAGNHIPYEPLQLLLLPEGHLTHIDSMGDHIRCAQEGKA